jgi:hypothetical protein
MHAILHNFDPLLLSKLQIFSPRLGQLLTIEMTVTVDSLNRALVAEHTELNYSDESYLCTLCLQIVREWSVSQTIAGGLAELTVALGETIGALSDFIRNTWSAKELFN